MNLVLVFALAVGFVTAGLVASIHYWEMRPFGRFKVPAPFDTRDSGVGVESHSHVASAASKAQRNEIESRQVHLLKVLAEAPADLLDVVSDRIGQLLQANLDLQSEFESVNTRLGQQEVATQNAVHELHLDPLTGIANRRGWDLMLQSAREQQDRTGASKLYVLIADVDHFKQLNDSLGHASGDAALKAIAASLARTVTEANVARCGGEEFAMVVAARSIPQLTVVARSLLQEIRGTRFDGTSYPLSISLGVTRWNAEEAAEWAIKRADEALYAAKHHGRDQACLHDGESIVALCPPSATADSIREELIVRPNERRRHRRRCYRRAAQVAFGSPDQQEPDHFRNVECINISQSGLVFHMNFPPSSTTMLVKINEPQLPFLLFSELRSSTPLADGRWRISCEFIRRVGGGEMSDLCAARDE